MNHSLACQPLDRPKTPAWLLLIAIIAAAFLFCTPAIHANSYTLTCGAPAFPGTVSLGGVIGPVAASGVAFNDLVSVLGTDSADQKCAKIAAALSQTLANTQSKVFDTASVQVSGNVITVSGNGGSIVGQFGVIQDRTGEGNTLTVNTNTGQQVQLVVNPVFGAPDCSLSNHLQCVATAGETFSGAVSATGHNPFTFFAAADGVKTDGALLGSIIAQITNGLGIPDFCSDPTSTTTCQPTSGSFDPDTVTISWDGNTASDLANFSLQTVLAPVPEPSSWISMGTALVAVWRCRRRRY